MRPLSCEHTVSHGLKWNQNPKMINPKMWIPVIFCQCFRIFIGNHGDMKFRDKEGEEEERRGNN